MKLIIITIAILIISGITLATFRNYIDEVNVSRESDVSELGGLREYVGSSLTKLSNDLIAKSDMIYNNIPLRKNAISRHGTIMERVDELGDKIDKLDAFQKSQAIKNGSGAIMKLPAANTSFNMDLDILEGSLGRSGNTKVGTFAGTYSNKGIKGKLRLRSRLDNPNSVADVAGITLTF